MDYLANFIDQLKIEVQNLPGEVAHKDMVPYRLTASEALKKPLNYKLSAVLLLLYIRDGEFHFVLTERQAYNGKHSGQISLPGGKYEDQDENALATALRESEEEIGVLRSTVEIIGELTQIYIPVSNFLVQPFIGMSATIPDIIPDPREVKTVLHATFSELKNSENRIITKLETSPGVWMKDIPAFNLQGKIVWGATAIILNEFKFILDRMK